MEIAVGVDAAISGRAVTECMYTGFDPARGTLTRSLRLYSSNATRNLLRS